MAALALLLSLATSTLALQEFPLTPSDVALIRTSPSSASLPTSSPNSTCVLVPVTATSSSSPSFPSSCTWRTYQQCRRTPRVVSEAVYSAECREEGGLQLAGCRETTLERPLLHTVQVCRIVAEKQCMGPCFNCPTFCQPTQQGICEDSHSIRTEVEELEEEGEDEGEGGRVRVERDVVTSSRSCHTKQVEELCANVNCKFVRPREECTQSNSSTVVLLRERRCRVCQATAAERVVVQEECREETTKDCAGDPLARPWKKLCSAASDVPTNSLEEGRSRQGRLGAPSLQALLSSTVGSPVEELVVAALSKIHPSDLEAAASPVVVIPTRQGLNHLLASQEELVEEEQRLVEEEEALVREELEVVRRLGKEQEQPVRIDMNVKYEFLKPTTSTRSPESVYFDQLLLTQLQGSGTEEQERKEKAEEERRADEERRAEEERRVEEERREDVGVGSTTEQPPTPLLLNPRTIELGTTTTTTTTTTVKTATTTTTTTTTTTATTTTSTTTATTTTSTAGTGSPRRRLSPAELLRLCFSRGVGCDFSQNEVATEDVTAAPSSTTLPTSSTTLPASSTTLPASSTTSTPRPSASLASKARLKQRVMLCFFQGICSSDDATSPATTTPPPRPRPSPRAPSSRVPLRELVRSREGAREREEVRQEVRERARKCFFQGIC